MKEGVLDDLTIARHAFILCCGRCGHRSRVDLRRGTQSCHRCGSGFKHYRQVSEEEAQKLSGKGLKDAEISLGRFMGRGIVTEHTGEIPEELKRAYSEAIRLARRKDPSRMALRDQCRRRGEMYSVQDRSLGKAVQRIRKLTGE